MVICEGEKGADAATRLLPDFVAVSSPNGSKGAAGPTGHRCAGARSPLAGRRRRRAGLCTGSRQMRFKSRRSHHWRLFPPEGVAVGWDAADALAEGWEMQRVGSCRSAPAALS